MSGVTININGNSNDSNLILSSNNGRILDNCYDDNTLENTLENTLKNTQSYSITGYGVHNKGPVFLYFDEVLDGSMAYIEKLTYKKPYSAPEVFEGKLHRINPETTTNGDIKFFAENLGFDLWWGENPDNITVGLGLALSSSRGSVILSINDEKVLMEATVALQLGLGQVNGQADGIIFELASAKFPGKPLVLDTDTLADTVVALNSTQTVIVSAAHRGVENLFGSRIRLSVIDNATKETKHYHLIMTTRWTEETLANQPQVRGILDIANGNPDFEKYQSLDFTSKTVGFAIATISKTNPKEFAIALAAQGEEVPRIIVSDAIPESSLGRTYIRGVFFGGQPIPAEVLFTPVFTNVDYYLGVISVGSGGDPYQYDPTNKPVNALQYVFGDESNTGLEKFVKDSTGLKLIAMRVPGSKEDVDNGKIVAGTTIIRVEMWLQDGDGNVVKEFFNCQVEDGRTTDGYVESGMQIGESPYGFSFNGATSFLHGNDKYNNAFNKALVFLVNFDGLSQGNLELSVAVFGSDYSEFQSLTVMQTIRWKAADRKAYLVNMEGDYYNSSQEYVDTTPGTYSLVTNDTE